jgi:hypothetical protein
MTQNVPFSTLRTRIWRKYSFHKLTQFSQGNKGQDAAASNKDDYLWRDTCVSLTQLNMPIWNKRKFSPP